MPLAYEVLTVNRGPAAMLSGGAGAAQARH